MKKLLWIPLVMAFMLTGCACTGTCVLVKEDWDHYWNDSEAGAWESIKQEWADYWN